MFVFSDGAFEIVTAAGQQWGLENFRAIVSQPAAPVIAEPERIYREVKTAARPGPLDDDFSVLMVTFE